MRVSTLPSPGLLSNGTRLRIEAAKAISAVEINAGIPANAGKSSNAKGLTDFFNACVSSLSTLLEATAPTIVARSIAASNPNRIVLTYNEGLDKTHVPDLTDFVIAGQARAVAKITIDGPFVYLDVATPFIAGAVTVAYTQSATVSKRLQDISNNAAASFTAAAVTNSIV